MSNNKYFHTSSGNHSISSCYRGIKMDQITSTCRLAPKHVTYGNYLHIKKHAYFELRTGVFALLNCDDKGKLSKKYVIVELKCNPQTNTVYYICSCGKVNCLHISEICMLWGSDNDFNDEIEEFKYEYLTETLVGVYCNEINSYSILSKTKREIKCLKCLNKVKSCHHVKAFRRYKANDGNSTDFSEQQIFESKSTKTIPYFL